MIIDFLKQLIFNQQKMTDRGAIKMEFAVQLSGSGAVDAVRKCLEDAGPLDIDVGRGSVIVETTLPYTEVQQRIEDTGRRAVLTGFGGQSAVAIVNHGNEGTGVQGVVRFSSLSSVAGQRGAVVDGVIDGLAGDRQYRLDIHECGDISEGCASVGAVYDSSAMFSDAGGRATARFVNERIEVGDLIGRSVVVTEADAGERKLSCGIIARSAGIFQNYKKICACDGVTIWDERDRPIAGSKRREGNSSL